MEGVRRVTRLASFSLPKRYVPIRVNVFPRDNRNIVRNLSFNSPGLQTRSSNRFDLTKFRLSFSSQTAYRAFSIISPYDAETSDIVGSFFL